MAFEAERDRWRLWLAQAETFAKTDNHIDACARVRAICSEVDGLCGELPNDEALLREKDYFDKQLSRFLSRHEAWNQSVAERARSYEDRERELYDAENPGGRLG